MISYDRRGEGRNEKLKAKYTFEQSFTELNQIYKSYRLQKATLISKN